MVRTWSRTRPYQGAGRTVHPAQCRRQARSKLTEIETDPLGNLTGSAVETSVIPSSPLTSTESPRPPRAHGPPRGWCDPGRHRGRHNGILSELVSRGTPARTHPSVFAVGRRVYVGCVGERLAHVALTDDAGTDALARLADGPAVEILAWRPRGSDGTRYRVRSTRNGLEGCLAVASLRAHRSQPH
jgi:hypothetical protein